MESVRLRQRHLTEVRTNIAMTGVAASARVGNLIGSRSPLAAKFAGHASAMLSVIVGSVIMFAMLLAKDVSTTIT